MPPVENDYTPIIRQGTIEKAQGILGRRRARQSLPAAGNGEELILIEASGGSISAKGQITAGERYWGSLHGWVITDVSDHHLSFSFRYRDTDGAAGYEVEAVTMVTVADAAAVVRRNVRGVRTYIEPALRSKATGALSSNQYADGPDTLTKLNTRLGSHGQNLRALVGSYLRVADWLSAMITDLAIRFDAATAEHYDQLVAANRGAELSNTSLINQRRTAEYEIELRQAWAEYLGEQVSDPLKALVAGVAADPTAANIKELAEKLDEGERWQRDQFVATLNRLIDNKVVVELDDLRKTKVIIDGLQRGLTADAVGQPQPQRMIADDGQSRPDGTVTEAQIVDDEDDRSPYGSDRDWDN